MATKKKKNYYYVLVFTDSGPVYLTSIDRENKYAHWDREKAPMELGSSYAEDLVFGLNLNLNSSVVVKSTREITTQPYNYVDFECTFVRKESKDESDNSDSENSES